MKYAAILSALILGAATNALGIVDRFGANVGLVGEVHRIGKNLNPGIQGSISAESYLIIPLEFKAGATVQNKKEAGKTQLRMFPLTLSYINYFKKAARNVFFFKLGPGMVFEILDFGTDMQTASNLDPLMTASLGLDLRITEKNALRSELSYLFVYQTYMEKAKYNGHFVLISIGLVREI